MLAGLVQLQAGLKQAGGQGGGGAAFLTPGWHDAQSAKLAGRTAPALLVEALLALQVTTCQSSACIGDPPPDPVRARGLFCGRVNRVRGPGPERGAAAGPAAGPAEKGLRGVCPSHRPAADRRAARQGPRHSVPGTSHWVVRMTLRMRGLALSGQGGLVAVISACYGDGSGEKAVGAVRAVPMLQPMLSSQRSGACDGR